MNVKELKNLGYEVNIIHTRKHTFNAWGKRTLNSRGGKTVAVITRNGKTASGVAICAETDNYCKDTGRKIALSRAFVEFPDLRLKIPNLFVK